MHARIKICCISSVEEANLAVRQGADALGLVGSMPSGPGVIDDNLIREIAAKVPPAVGTFLLTQRTLASEIADHVRHCGTNTVQVVNHIDPGEWPKLIDLLPRATRRVQVIHVEGSDAIQLIDQYAPYVHAFLLDSGRPSAEVPELGGTGRIHDWDISARFAAISPKPCVSCRWNQCDKHPARCFQSEAVWNRSLLKRSRRRSSVCRQVVQVHECSAGMKL